MSDSSPLADIEVEEGSTVGGGSCEGSSPEHQLLTPDVKMTIEDNDDDDENLIPFNNLAVELYEDGANSELSVETTNQKVVPELGEITAITGVADGYSENTRNTIDDGSIVGFDPNVILQEESFDDGGKEVRKTYAEDFLFSSASNSVDGSFNFESDEMRAIPLSRFPKIVKAIEIADYEVIQALYHLLFERSAWDKHELLAKRILDFSGFGCELSSEDYFNKDMMLRGLTVEILNSIANILCIQDRGMLLTYEEQKDSLVSSIMDFLTKPFRRGQKSSKLDNEVRSDSPSRNFEPCGCRRNCLALFPYDERRQLLQELNNSKDINAYLSKRIYKTRTKQRIRRQSVVSEGSTRNRFVSFHYTVKCGNKEETVCKVAFCTLYDVSNLRMKHLQESLKFDDKSKFKKASPKAIPQVAVVNECANDELSSTSNSQSPVAKSESKASCQYPMKDLPAGPASSKLEALQFNTEQILKMEEDLKKKIATGKLTQPKVCVEKIDPNNFKLADGSFSAGTPPQPQEAEKCTPAEASSSSSTSTKEEVTQPPNTKKMLKDFALVVRSIENTPQELLLDIHFLLFLTGSDLGKLKNSILEFTGFTFDEETEDYDERKDFLGRMSGKAINDVAATFSLKTSENKDETISNILCFLMKMDESLLKSKEIPVLSDVELDLEGMSDSDDSITCEVIEKKKVECIDLISSGDEDDSGKKPPKERPKEEKPQEVTSKAEEKSVQSTSTSGSNQESKSGTVRTLGDFETIYKIVYTHPDEYLVDIFELLYMRRPEILTLRRDILDFNGFKFERGSSEFLKRKQFLDRMLYNSVRRIYNTLIHTTTEVRVFSKPTMITEIFQFLMCLPDHDTSKRLQQPPPPRPLNITPHSQKTIPGILNLNIPQGSSLPGKLSDLKRVFQRVACFPCEYLIDVHKLLFMTDCDSKLIRQNIFGFKGFSFSADSPEFQQRKMYLEYLTFHSLRKISSVLTTRSVDLRNSTKHELASHLTQVLAEYTNTYLETDPIGTEKPFMEIVNVESIQPPITTTTDTEVENIVVTPLLDPLHAGHSISPESSQSSDQTNDASDSNVSSSTPSNESGHPKTGPSIKNTPTICQSESALGITIVSAHSVAPKNVSSKSQKRKAVDPPAILPKPQDEGVTSERMKYLHSGFLKLPVPRKASSKPAGNTLIGEPRVANKTKKLKTSLKASSTVPTTKIHSTSEEAVSSFHSKLRDAINEEENEDDCDKPLAAFLGHPNDRILREQICDIVEQTNLQDITINDVVQKIYNMYPKFDLSYRKEFIKSTLRSLLYKLGEQKSSEEKSSSQQSPDCSVSTSDM